MEIDTGKRALLGALGAAALGTVLMAAAAVPKPRVIKVVARKFEFVPGQIRVRQGEPVILRFTAPEVPMGFNLPDFGIRADIVPGKPVSVAFTPDKPGTFTFLCDVFCGSGHEDMNGSLIVG